ncbi:MAG: SAM-dependent chlorinase/fluorinase [Bacteroidales bacterium]|jgi:S-adenosylmethionine hydrolase|nr:SAM-dependent chlorinase/fluorinase [Bacteroidales bacterium]
MNSNIVTLTTDWGSSDNYTAIFKAHIYREYQDIKIVDVTHEVKKNTIRDAAFLVKNMYHYFPKRSIHIIDVNYLSPYNESMYRKILKTEQSEDCLYFTHYLAFCYDEHYFLCENNGIVSLLCDVGAITEIVKISPCKTYEHFYSFKAISYWIKAATSLAKGEALNSIGEKYDLQFVELLRIPSAFISGDQKNKIVFHSQYIDSYGNIITNLDKDFFDEIAEGRTTFDFYCTQTGTKKRRKISREYNNNSDERLILLFGHNGYLEISARYAPFAKILRTEFLNLEFTITFPSKIEPL